MWCEEACAKGVSRQLWNTWHRVGASNTDWGDRGNWEGFAGGDDIWAESRCDGKGAPCALKCQEDYPMWTDCFSLARHIKTFVSFYQLKWYWFCPLPFLWSVIKQWNLIYSQFCFKVTYMFLNSSCCTEHYSLGFGKGARDKHEKNFIRDIHKQIGT